MRFRSTGFLALDAIAAIGLIAALALIFTAAYHQQQAALRESLAHKNARLAAEAALYEIHAQGVAAEIVAELSAGRAAPGAAIVRSALDERSGVETEARYSLGAEQWAGFLHVAVLARAPASSGRTASAQLCAWIALEPAK